jgi:hypothetical protein
MATSRRIVRKVEPSHAITFDDQLWPINAALLVLSGFAAGAIIALSNFEDPRLWANGWVRLSALGAGVALLISIASQIDSQRIRRGLQLAALLSVIFHLALVVALHSQRLEVVFHEPDDQKMPDTRDIVALPEYFVPADEQPQEHERPLDVAAPQVAQVRVTREERPIEQPTLESQPTPVPGPTPEVAPNPVEARQLEEAVPRSAQDASLLSKQTSLQPFPDETPLEVPPTETQEAQEVRKIEPRAAAVARQQADSSIRLEQLESDSTLAPQPQAVEVARRDVESTAALPSVASPSRSIERLELTPDAQAATLPPESLAPEPTPSQAPQPRPLPGGIAQGTAGLPGRPAASPAHAAVPRARPPATPELDAASPRPSGAAGGDAPRIASSRATDISRRPSAVGDIDTQAAELANVPTTATDAVPAPPGVARSSNSGPPARPRSALPVETQAPQALGGLGPRVTPQVGSLSRRARSESELVHAGSARFPSRKVGGPLAIDGQARVPAEAFARRTSRRDRQGGGPDQPSAQTEAAIERGLEYLARQQQPEGNWSLQRANVGGASRGAEVEFRSDTAATGLALLAFLGAGYDHFDGRYQQVVANGLKFLTEHQRSNGDLFVPADKASNQSGWLYSHGIAAIALCEAYGMTGDKSLREPAQKAIDFIVASQDPQLGGWRYVPRVGSDTSVSGWQVMALKSGELAGLRIEATAYARTNRWLNEAQAAPNDPARYVYNPRASNSPDQQHGRFTTPSMTSVGLLMRLYLGWNRTHPEMIEGAEYLAQHLPALGTRASTLRDTYYWYYATQVMFHMRGRHWQAWNNSLRPMLIDSQVTRGALAGSWDPAAPVPDKWGERAGRIYMTTMNLLSLEVYYRHLPLYESAAK